MTGEGKGRRIILEVVNWLLALVLVYAMVECGLIAFTTLGLSPYASTFYSEMTPDGFIAVNPTPERIQAEGITFAMLALAIACYLVWWFIQHRRKPLIALVYSLGIIALVVVIPQLLMIYVFS